MNILPIDKVNLHDCIDIFISAYNQAPWNHNWTFAKAKTYLSEYADSPGFVGFVLYDGNKPVGATFAHKILMEHCNQYARANQIGLLILMTNKYMPAYKFYDRLGYITADQYLFMFKQLA